jgi:hypothetical protein
MTTLDTDAVAAAALDREDLRALRRADTPVSHSAFDAGGTTTDAEIVCRDAPGRWEHRIAVAVALTAYVDDAVAR